MHIRYEKPKVKEAENAKEYERWSTDYIATSNGLLPTSSSPQLRKIKDLTLKLSHGDIWSSKEEGICVRMGFMKNLANFIYGVPYSKVEGMISLISNNDKI